MEAAEPQSVLVFSTSQSLVLSIYWLPFSYQVFFPRPAALGSGEGPCEGWDSVQELRESTVTKAAKGLTPALELELFSENNSLGEISTFFQHVLPKSLGKPELHWPNLNRSTHQFERTQGAFTGNVSYIQGKHTHRATILNPELYTNTTTKQTNDCWNRGDFLIYAGVQEPRQ